MDLEQLKTIDLLYTAEYLFLINEFEPMNRSAGWIFIQYDGQRPHQQSGISLFATVTANILIVQRIATGQ
jgi:hypothetical protein